MDATPVLPSGPAQPVLHQRLQARADQRTVAARMAAKTRPLGNVVFDSRPVAGVENREPQFAHRARARLAPNNGRHGSIPHAQGLSTL